MSYEQGFPTPTPITEVEPAPSIYIPAAEQFLGDAGEYISKETLERIVAQAETYEEPAENNESSTAPIVTYDKYKKSFVVNNQHVTAGALIASRHLGTTIALPEDLEKSLDGRKLRSAYSTRKVEDRIYDDLNKVLAEALATETEKKDVLKAKAYRAIAERSGNTNENKQLGVLAEKIVHGVAEMIAIDRPDLGIAVHAANAYQDVEEKIDFIIATKQKRRGAGIDTADLPPEEKNVGIQFTINTAKESFKRDQITKAKDRGIDIDDIVYVAIDSTLLRSAVQKWEAAGKSVTGPWEYLPTETKKKALSALFNSVLTEEQELSLLKQV